MKKTLLALMMVLGLFVGTASHAAAPVFDAAVASPTDGSPWSHTVGVGSGTVLVVVINSRFNNPGITGVTYNLVPMTLVSSQVGVGGQNSGTLTSWVLFNPPTGAHQIVITKTNGGNMTAFSLSYFGVGSIGASSGNIVVSTDVTNSISTTQPGSLVVGVAGLTDLITHPLPCDIAPENGETVLSSTNCPFCGIAGHAYSFITTGPGTYSTHWHLQCTPGQNLMANSLELSVVTLTPTPSPTVSPTASPTTIPLTAPTGLNVTFTDYLLGSVGLGWTMGTGQPPLTTEILMNGNIIGTVKSNRGRVKGLDVDTVLNFTVRTLDGLGRQSTDSNQVSAFVGVTPVPPLTASSTFTITQTFTVTPTSTPTPTATPTSTPASGGIFTLAIVGGNSIAGIARDSNGNVFVADDGGAKVREISSSGVISVFAGTGGTGYAGDGGPATSAVLNTPKGIAVDSSNNVYIADTGNGTVRKVLASTGVISTVAGTGVTSYTGDGGPATSATLRSPSHVVVASNGDIYVGSFTGIRKITAATGIITTYAGNATTGGFSGDGGPATAALLQSTTFFGLALDSSGNLFIGDTGNIRVREVVASTGNIVTYAGTGASGSAGDGGPATSALLSVVRGLAEDASNNLYIADQGGHTVRKVVPAGTITTFAGTPTVSGCLGDGGPATSATLTSPQGLATSSLGDLFITDFCGANKVVRQVEH